MALTRVLIRDPGPLGLPDSIHSSSSGGWSANSASVEGAMCPEHHA